IGCRPASRYGAAAGRRVPVAPHRLAAYLFLQFAAAHRHLHSFPTRRSSDLPPGMQVPQVGPSKRLDYELELGIFIGTGNEAGDRSEEHTSELQSRRELVCRLLLEKKK